MKSKILLLALSVAFLTSCSTAYKTGQTPDDVYYSPARPEDEYVKVEQKEDRNRNNYDDEYYDDQYLRMKVRDRYRWSEIDDPYYYNRRYNTMTYNCSCFGNPWTPSVYWNSHYNPYYSNTVYISPKNAGTYTAPRTFNLGTYNNNALTNGSYTNPKTGSSSNPKYNNTYNAPRNDNTRRDDNSGNILRDIFRGSSNSGSNNNSSGSSTNNSSSSSGSSSSSSTPAPVRKF